MGKEAESQERRAKSGELRAESREQRTEVITPCNRLAFSNLAV